MLSDLKMKPEVNDQEVNPSNHESELETLPKSRRAKLKASIWDTWDKSPRERKLVQKVDWWLLSYACTAYFIKSLDQSNASGKSIGETKHLLTRLDLQCLRFRDERGPGLEG